MTTLSKSIVLVQHCELRKTRNNENFYTMKINLGRTGDFATLEAKIWQCDRYTQAGRELPCVGMLIETEYRTDEYRGMPQWTIEEFRVLEEGERETAMENFVPSSTIDVEFYRERLERLLEEVDPARVSGQILFEVFDRPDFREEFYHAPAATYHHQNYPGGLLEHTINVTCLALSIANAYGPGPGGGGLSVNSERLVVDRNLIICAGLLHDIGKMDTYRLSPLADITDSHRFEGHLAIGYALVRELAAPLKANPPYAGAADEIDKLLNCILGHHGQLEFGSPVVPACVEAMILSLADLGDARISSIVTGGNNMLRRDPNARWLRHPHFAGGIFLGDWPPPPPAADAGENHA